MRKVPSLIIIKIMSELKELSILAHSGYLHGYFNRPSGKHFLEIVYMLVEHYGANLMLGHSPMVKPQLLKAGHTGMAHKIYIGAVG